MKNEVYRMALAAITATAVCLGASWNAASAQNMATNPAAAPQAAPSVTANPSGIFPPAGAAQSPAWPSGVSEVMKLYKSGISTDIIVSYINNSPLSFFLSADNLIALQHEGVPAPVLTAMMQRYGELQRQSAMAAAAPVPSQAPAPPPPSAAPLPVPAQAPPPQYYSYPPAQPAVSYPYPVAAPAWPAYDPYYYDPYYYPWYPFGGPVVFDFGFGHAGGFGGHWGGGGRR
jgi:hypothetical protein